jgi:cobalt-zinc-cadmium efflux system outer membrane protein
MRTLAVALMTATLTAVTTLASAQAGTSALPLTLQQLEQLALDNNPTLRAAQSAIDAAHGRARQAGAWPNPIVGYSAEEIAGGRNTEPRGSHGLFVEQTIPLGGKLRLSRRALEHVVDEADARAELQRERVLSSVRTLFYQVLIAERRIEVHERLVVLGSEATGVTAQLFNVGAADRPDVLETQIEMRRVRLELNRARNQVFALRYQLAAVVGLPDAATRPLAGAIDQPIPELERDATFQALVERSPQIRAARAAVARAQAITARERRQTYPDLFLRGGMAYNRERESTGQPIGWEGQVEGGITIPLFNRNQGGIAAARAEETRAQAEVARLELSLRARLAGEFATYLTALRSAESYRQDILPLAEQSYTLHLARYGEMAAAYPQVLVAQRTLFETAREYLNQLETGWQSALRLQGLLAGEGLDAPAGGDAESPADVSTGNERE